MTRARSLLDVLEHADDTLASGASPGAGVWPTGFMPLDELLGGGLRAGELTLLAGAQGLGKTTFALQVARNVAAAGGNALYLCYEHREQDVLERLLALEMGLHGGPESLTLARLRALTGSAQQQPGGLVDRLTRHEGGLAALEQVSAYGARLRIATVAGRRTGLDELTRLVLDPAQERPLVVVDYLQKVRAEHAGSDESERVTEVAEGLKDLALKADVPVLAIAAVDRAGLESGRTRLHHLRGSTALAYEADVALLLNDKYGVVARHHLMFGAGNAEDYHRWVVCSIEKNRSGSAGVDLEFRTRFERGHFDADGRYVAEQLLDDRVHVE